MAIPWIKIETSLPRKPEVMQLADILGIDEFAVVGHLVCFWSWADETVSLECPVVTGTKRGLDRVAGRDGFADAMITVGWLQMEGNAVSIPHLDYHLDQGAKTRALEQRKKAKQRVKAEKPVLSRKCPDNSGTTPGPEERRGEKNESLYGGEKNSPLTQTQIAHDFSDVVIPTKMQTPECAATAARWFEYLSQIGAQHKRPDQSPIALQEWWMQMARLGPEGFHEAVSRSIVSKHQTVKNLPDDMLPKGPTAKPVDKPAGDEWQRALMVLRQHNQPNKTSAAARKAALAPDVYQACATVGIMRIAQADQYSEGKIRESFEFILQEIRNGNVTT